MNILTAYELQDILKKEGAEEITVPEGTGFTD
ncbi:hypothetical protein HKBW3S43_01821, partial [Candidatus Hakubella thermalkaliphila]